MGEFAYNNAKNASSSHTVFELNCNFYPQVSYKKDIDSWSQSKAVNKLAIKQKKLITVCKKNSSIPQNFINNIMINMQSLEAMSQITKSGLIANTSKPSKITS